MKKIFAFGLFCSLVICGDVLSAPASRSNARTRAPAGQAVTTQSANAAATNVSATASPVATTNARAAARRAPSSSGATAQSGAPAQVNARAATNQPAAPQQRVNARAATTQKAISSGTKIAGATANTVISEECRTKYFGCMDAFCMLDNTNGGRCLCSNRHAELEKVLDEIQQLDEQSYAMATSGVERINMGDSADAVQQMGDKITGDIQNSDNNRAKGRARTLNLDAWNNVYESTEEDIFGTSDAEISDKTGDALQAAVSDMCVKQMPECSANFSMLKLLYSQQIKSDCTAYENSLKQQKNSSAKKLQTAQQAMRDAALEQYQNANKYDLGQCTLRFKQCMQTTAGCGDDFSGCASMVAMDNAQTKVGGKNKTKTYTINTGVTSITIGASTYDILTSKKPMCDSVTQQCTSVKDQVWNTFLREVAPEIKSAELIAESNVRMNCIGNISDCFQKACKDNIDPDDPDGSYDMCLTRPETVRSLCKVQIDPCEAAEPKILDYVYARLASMRVDACTTQVKNCLVDSNRCGPDYSNCIGLDFETIRDMCPLDKLVGCQKNGQAATWAVIDNIVMGIYLNIDNSLLNSCVNLVNAKMLDICGDGDECMAFDDDEYIGTDSLTSYKNNNGSFIIEGLVSFGKVKVKETESKSDDVKFGRYELDIDGYVSNFDNVSGADGMSSVKKKVLSSLQSTQSKINQKMALLTSDPKISMCVYGRDVSQIRGGGRSSARAQTEGRYPHLLDSAIMSIIDAGLTKASENYAKKYNEMVATAVENQSDERRAALCSAVASSVSSLQGEDKISPVAAAISAVTQKKSYSGMDGSGYELRHVIDGMTFGELAQITSLNSGGFIQTNDAGVMIASIVKSSVYSTETNECTLTTTTQYCKNMEAVVVETSKTSCGNGGVFSWSCGGFSLVGGNGKVTTEKSYQGTICTDMSDPVTTVEVIKM